MKNEKHIKRDIEIYVKLEKNASAELARKLKKKLLPILITVSVS